jgi:hypothetical protein
MPNHQAGLLQRRAVWAPSQCQMFLRCTTASYHAGDFRKEKTKMEDEFGLAGKRGGLAKPDPQSHTLRRRQSVLQEPAPFGRAIARPVGYCALRLSIMIGTQQKPGARPGFALKR